MTEEFEIDDNGEFEYKSKSQLKREMEALQKIGKEIAELPPHRRKELPLTEEMEVAFATADKIRNKKEGWRRQLQFIGKLMRNVDAEPIILALEKIRNQGQQATKELHLLETTRDQLMQQGDEKINQLIGEYHDFDRQKLRQLVRKAQKEQKVQAEQAQASQKVSPPKAYRELFQYLKSIMN